MSHTPVDSHFVTGNVDIDVLGHRPHKTAMLVVQAMTATALFRVWPTLLFMGGWSAAIVLINKNTAAELTVPSTMLTVLGVVLGLTLSYRTSSAYDRYWEGRRLWSQIILITRTWARIVWIHCPDTMLAPPDPAEEAPELTVAEKELDECRAILEKKTMVQLALAFAIAVKHYLRGEEGMCVKPRPQLPRCYRTDSSLYEDLYDLVKFIPSLNLPSGIPAPGDANNASGDPLGRRARQASVETGTYTESTLTDKPSHRVHLNPARDPPKFRWSETFPIKFLVTKRQRLKAQGRTAMRKRMREIREGGGVGHNVPLEISMFMSCWIADMQRRKTVDVSTINNLILPVASLNDALASLERILTTPIPWSYNAHIWEVTYIYCLLLPFQLYGAGFDWVTIPATVITAYIVIGFIEVGAEIENPFGYDSNDLNMDFFCQEVVKKELNAITARPFARPEEWIFSAGNTFGGLQSNALGADALQHFGKEKIRDVLKYDGTIRKGRARARSLEDA